MLRILVTRPKNQSAAFGESLRAAGFEPVYFPVIEIRPVEDTTDLDNALGKLGCYDWIVFTSVNGVEAFWKRLVAYDQAARAAEQLRTLKIAAIGPKTAEALRSHGFQPVFVPDEFVAEAILPGMGDLRGRWVLLPRAEIARKALPEAIQKAGGMVQEIPVYHTLAVQPGPEELDALRAGLDWLTFTSPSTVSSFVAILRQNGLDPFHLPGNPKIACIGPITRQAAQGMGYEVAVMAGEFTTEGLVSGIKNTLEAGWQS